MPEQSNCNHSDYCNHLETNIEKMKESFEKMEIIMDELKNKCYIMNHKIVGYESRIERLERLVERG